MQPAANPFDKFNNQADVLDLNKWLSAQQSANGKSQTVKPKAKGNFLTHLIPTIGGTAGGVGGGAVGGALAGSAVLPGIGTVAGGLLGALLGGAAGGAGGKIAENKIEGNKDLLSGVPGQAAEQGVLSAGPLRLLKGAKAGIGAIKGADDLAGVINAAGDGATKSVVKNASKNLITQGEAAQGRVAGVSAGSKEGGNVLSPQDTKAMLNTLKGEGIKTGNANNTFRDVQAKLSQYGQQIGNHFTQNNTPLTKSAVSTIGKDFTASLKTSDPTILKQAKILTTDLKNNVTDTKSLWQFRKGIDAKIPDAKFGTDAATTAKVTALKALRTHISKELGDVPGASNYHALSEIKPFIAAEAKRANNPSGGIAGRIFSSGPAQKGEAIVGKGLVKAGNSLAGSTNPVGVKAIASRTLPLGIAQAGASSLPQATPQTATADPNSAGDFSSFNSLSDSGGSDLTSALSKAGQGGSPYTTDNLKADLARDPANASKYIDYYNSLDKIFNSSSSSSNANTIKPTNQQYGLAEQGTNALQQLAQLIQQNPDVVKANQTPGQGLPIIGNYISNAVGAGAYHPLGDAILQSLIHLETGATATPEEVKAARGQLPGPADSPEEQQNKINNLLYAFQKYSQGGQVDSSSSSSSGDSSGLLSALMAAQGQQ